MKKFLSLVLIILFLFPIASAQYKPISGVQSKSLDELTQSQATNIILDEAQDSGYQKVSDAPPALPAEATTVVYTPVKLYQGWNLVKMPFEKPTIELGKDDCTGIGLSERTRLLGGQDVFSTYIYDPFNKKYVKKGISKYEPFVESNKGYSMNVSVWIKTVRNCTAYYDSSFNTTNFSPVRKGWNFLAFSKNNLGKSLNDISGTCNFVTAYTFDGAGQKWDKLSLDNPLRNSDFIGSGLLVKAEADCELFEDKSISSDKAVIKINVSHKETEKPLNNILVNLVVRGVKTPFSTDESGNVSAEVDEAKSIYFSVFGEDYVQYTSQRFDTLKGSLYSFDVKLEPSFSGHTDDGSPFKGGKDAFITIYEYGSYRSPQTKGTHEMFKELFNRYGSLIKLVHKAFPLIEQRATNQQYVGTRYVANPDTLSILAERAARCADDQGKFWKYNDKLYEKQNLLIQYTSVNDGKDLLKEIARDLGLNRTEFDSCIDSTKYQDKVTAELNQAIYDGVTGSPSYRIISTPIEQGKYSAAGTALPKQNLETKLQQKIELYHFVDVLEEKLFKELYELSYISRLSTSTPISYNELFKGKPVKYPNLSTYTFGDAQDDVLNSPIKVKVLVFCDVLNEDCKRQQKVLNDIFVYYEKTCIPQEAHELNIYRHTKCLDVSMIIHKELPQKDNPLSFTAAEAMKCAANLEKYIEFEDKMYQNQDSLSLAKMKSIAKEIGLDSKYTSLNAFSQCLNYHNFRSGVEDDVADAEKLGVTKTPTMFVNGVKLEGFKSFDEMKVIMDKAIDVDGWHKTILEHMQRKKNYDRYRQEYRTA